MEKKQIKILAGVVVLLLVLMWALPDDTKIDTGETTKTEKGETTQTSGTKPYSPLVVKPNQPSTSVSKNAEFPFSFTEKNLIPGTVFGEFTYSGEDFDNYHKFYGSADVTGQIIVVKSDGTHNLGIRVNKGELYKLPQYYFSTVAGEAGQYNFVRANAPYDLCFGYYHPQAYDYNKLLDKLASKAGQEVKVKIDNYKIITAKEKTGACASLVQIFDNF